MPSSSGGKLCFGGLNEIISAQLERSYHITYYVFCSNFYLADVVTHELMLSNKNTQSPQTSFFISTIHVTE